MSSRAVARLVVGSLAAFGAVTLAVHLADEPASSATVSPSFSSIATSDPAHALPAYDVAGGTTLRSTQSVRTALESTLDRPEPEAEHPGVQLVPIEDAEGVLPAHEDLGPIHVDPMPEGVSLSDPTDTESLYERAGLAPELAAAADPDVTAGAPSAAVEEAAADVAADFTEAQVAAAPIPAGTPSIRGLSAHVAPSCTGTGTDGKRVQVLYVRMTSTPSRYSSVLSLLRNEVANVDDVFALSARQTGGERRVRWVHTNCVPVISEVVVPDGSLNTNFMDTISALRSAGYTDRNRKYLAFTEANNLCGVGTMYGDTRPIGNNNDGYAASYSRVDVNCWSHSKHSVAAHELVHNLGGVLPGAPNVTANGHCTDESDLMCYVDGPGVTMRSVCASSQEQLLDCRGDDYFNTAPAPGNFLATSWNTANSSFLDIPGATAPTPTTPTVPTEPTDPTSPAESTAWSTTRASSGTPSVVSAVLTSVSSGRPVAGALVELQSRGSSTQPWVTVRTGLVTDANGKVATSVGRVTAAWYRFAYVDLSGSGSSASSPVLVKAKAKARAAWTGSRSTVDGLVARLDGSPVAGATMTLQRRYGGSSSWVTVAKVTSTAGGKVTARQKPRRTAYYRWVYKGSAELLAVRSSAVRAR